MATCKRCNGDGIQWWSLWLGSEPPAACKVGILRNSFREPLWVHGTYDYYVPRNAKGEPAPSNFWKGEKGAHQLAKCVEELALRKAFPRRLGQIYGTDEMQQAPRPATLPKRSQRLAEAQDVAFEALPAESVSRGGQPSPPSTLGRSEGDTITADSTGGGSATLPPPVVKVQTRSSMPDEYRRKAGLGAIHKLCNDRGLPDADYREALIQLFGVERFKQGSEDEPYPTSKVLDLPELEKLWLYLNDRTKP